MGTVPGIKAAAVRKLKHELGIVDIRPDQLKYLTRIHYWAADPNTVHEEIVWGENEIDYILFVQADVSTDPNLDEIRDTKYVSYEEFQQMIHPSSGNLWSPWFRIIAEKFLSLWWKDLHTTLNSDDFVDLKTIHRF